MSVWDDFQREDREGGSKVTGRLRCVIVDVEEATSKSSGLPMIVITVRPSGTTFKIKNWLVHNEHFNRNATDFFDAFPEIGVGNFNFIEWVGAMGAANFVEDDNGYLKVKYWISAEKAENLPPFEGERPERQTVTVIPSIEEESADGSDDLPWI